MTLPHYTERGYEAARQKARYHTDPAYRLDRINRARKRFGLPAHRSLLHARIKFMFADCFVDSPRLRRARLIAGLSVAEKRTQERANRDRITVLRKRLAA